MGKKNVFQFHFNIKKIYKEMLSEFLGTFVLVLMLIGNGAQNVLSNGKAGDTLTGQLGTGFAVMMGVMVSGNMSGAHINPVMSLGLAWVGKFPWKKVPGYVLAQFVASFVAAGVAYLVYKDALLAYDGDPYSMKTAAIYTSFPAPWLPLWNAMVDAMFSAAMLCLLNLAVGDSRNMDVKKSFSPMLFGFMVTCIVSGYSYNCGNPMNPARDFGPRVFMWAAGWGTEVFNGPNYSWWWIPLVFPHIGTIIGGTIYMLLIENHHPEQEEGEGCQKLVELEPGCSKLLSEKEQLEVSSRF